jgi:multiple sugar transport system permease protein
MRWTGKHTIRFIILCLIGCTMTAPFIWMVTASFKTRQEAEAAHFLPRNPTVSNYPVVLDLQPHPVTGEKLGMRFGRWYYNSFFLAAAITLFQVMTSAMAAYAFSRLHWPARDQVFFLYLATIMIPRIVIMIPTFQVMVALGFLNTYHGLILPAAFTAFGTFLLRQFMLSIPTSLDEAAKIDGASHWRIFWDIIFPLARPGLIALAIITFLQSYQSFFWPLIMLNDSQLYPMAVGLLGLDSTYGRQTELIMAAAVMNILPLIIIFSIFQRFLVEGLQLGAVKG